MVQKIFKCIICNENTINPRGHIQDHTLYEITQCFVELTLKTGEEVSIDTNTTKNTNTIIKQKKEQKKNGLSEWGLTT